MSATEALRLSGAMHLRTLADPYAALVQAFAAGTDLTLDLSEVEEADLTFVQLIVSAQRTAEAQGVNLALAAPAPEPILQVLERGGFIGPAPDARRDFWLAQ
jgi:ABC-type transporter Mla MlaB component